MKRNRFMATVIGLVLIVAATALGDNTWDGTYKHFEKGIVLKQALVLDDTHLGVDGAFNVKLGTGDSVIFGPTATGAGLYLTNTAGVVSLAFKNAALANIFALASDAATMSLPADVTIGANGVDGTLKLYSEQGGTDYFTKFQNHTTMTQEVTYTLPANDGDANNFLQSNGSGALTWAMVDISNSTNLSASGGIVLTGDALAHGAAADGYGHVPDAGATTQLLQWSSDGVAKWITVSGQATIANAGAVTLQGSPTFTNVNATGDLVLSSGKTFQVTLQGNGAGAATTYTMPINDGDSNNVLHSNGSGTLSWAMIDISAETNLAGTSGQITLTGDVLSLPNDVTVGAAGTDGTLTLYSEQGGTDYSVKFQPAAAMTMAVTYTLPVDDGTTGQFLITDGSGVLAWSGDYPVCYCAGSTWAGCSITLATNGMRCLFHDTDDGQDYDAIRTAAATRLSLRTFTVTP